MFESGISYTKQPVNGQAEEFSLCLESRAWGIYFISLFYHLNWEQQNHNLEITAVDSSPFVPRPSRKIGGFDRAQRVFTLGSPPRFFCRCRPQHFLRVCCFFCTYFLSAAATLTVMYGRERGRTMNKQRHKLLDSRRGRNLRVCVCVFFFFFSNRVSAFLQPVSCHSTYLPGERNCTWNIFQKPNHGRARGRPGTMKKRERDSWVKENEIDWGRGEQEGDVSET